MFACLHCFQLGGSVNLLFSENAYLKKLYFFYFLCKMV